MYILIAISCIRDPLAKLRRRETIVVGRARLYVHESHMGAVSNA